MVMSTSAGFTLLADVFLFVIIAVLTLFLILFLLMLVYFCKADRGIFWHFCAIQAPHIIIIIMLTIICRHMTVLKHSYG